MICEFHCELALKILIRNSFPFSSARLINWRAEKIRKGELLVLIQEVEVQRWSTDWLALSLLHLLVRAHSVSRNELTLEQYQHP